MLQSRSEEVFLLRSNTVFVIGYSGQALNKRPYRSPCRVLKRGCPCPQAVDLVFGNGLERVLQAAADEREGAHAGARERVLSDGVADATFDVHREEVDALKKFVSLKADNGSAYLKLGSAYSRLGQYEDAVKNLDIAKKYFPKNPLLYNNLGVAYGKIGKTNDEIQALQKAISLRPRYTTARYNLAMSFLRQGRRDQALKQYDEIRKFDEGAASALKKEIDSKR